MAAPRKENIKEVILNATCALLETQALADISLAQIAETAGVSKGTLYYHYKTKGEIFFDITDRYLNEQMEDFVRWTENKEKDTSIQRLVKYVVERNTSSAGLRMHLFYEAQLGDTALQGKLQERYSAFHQSISQKIAERTDFPADFLTWLILLASDGIIVQEAIKNESFDTNAFIQQGAKLLEVLGKEQVKPTVCAIIKYNAQSLGGIT